MSGGNLASAIDELARRWCEVHHVKHRIDGGATKLDNLKLECRPHLHHEHENDPGNHAPP